MAKKEGGSVAEQFEFGEVEAPGIVAPKTTGSLLTVQGKDIEKTDKLNQVVLQLIEDAIKFGVDHGYDLSNSALRVRVELERGAV